MRRISTDADYLRDGTVTLDADGIPLEWSTKADTDYVDARDQALGERITDEKWYRPMLRSGDTLDDKRGAGAVGVYPVTGAVAGTPRNAAGWVEVFYNADTSSTTQRFFAASWDVSGAWEREYWAGSWREWRDTSMQTAIAGKADAVHEHTASQITDLHHYSGTGFPEGKVAAPVGSIYTDRQATAGAVRWIKTTGTGNTGWQVEYGDTGWRDITASLEPGKLDIGNGGYLRARRTERFLEYAINNMTVVGTGNLFETPAGFRVDTSQSANVLDGSGVFQASRWWLAIFGIPVGQNLSLDREFVIRFNARPEEWPSTLPGTPV